MNLKNIEIINKISLKENTISDLFWESYETWNVYLVLLKWINLHLTFSIIKKKWKFYIWRDSWFKKMKWILKDEIEKDLSRVTELSLLNKIDSILNWKSISIKKYLEILTSNESIKEESYKLIFDTFSIENKVSTYDWEQKNWKIEISWIRISKNDILWIIKNSWNFIKEEDFPKTFFLAFSKMFYFRKSLKKQGFDFSFIKSILNWFDNLKDAINSIEKDTWNTKEMRKEMMDKFIDSKFLKWNWVNKKISEKFLKLKKEYWFNNK